MISILRILNNTIQLNRTYNHKPARLGKSDQQVVIIKRPLLFIISIIVFAVLVILFVPGNESGLVFNKGLA